MMFVRTLTLAALVAGAVSCSSPRSADVYPKDMGSIAPGHQMENAPGWYRDAVIYHIWVRAFADGAYGDGIGDLAGIRAHLPYLQSLGVNTLWLSPIFECAYKGDNMHGYDTTDYYAINNRFGTQADLQQLIDDVHAKGMRILFDFVPNHTSTQHPWFTDAATRGSWYLWQGTVPSGWGFPWGGGVSSDVWRPGALGYYYTSFGVDSLADLNFYNPEVTTQMQAVAGYWLDRGFDGMRMDAARYLCESGPGQAADQPDTHLRLQAFRALLDTYDTGDAHPHPGGDPTKHSAKAMIAEAWTNDASGVTPYYGNGANEFHMCLDFSAPLVIFQTIDGADATRLAILWDYEQSHYPAGYRAAVFDSNHDNLISRPGTLYGGQKNKIILHEALDILSPGTPILYYGNEIGMAGRAGRDLDLRQPMDWAAAGAQSTQPDSILSWCGYLIHARSAYASLRSGTYATLATDLGPSKALAYVMASGTERIVVLANLTSSSQSITLTDLTAHGVPADGKVQAVLGDPRGVTALSGTTYLAKDVPPYALRVLYASGGAFQATLHGDLQ